MKLSDVAGTIIEVFLVVEIVHLRESCIERPRGRSKSGLLAGSIFESVPPPEKTSVVEHVLVFRVDGPVVALHPTATGQLDEAFIERQVMPNGALPPLGVRVVPVVGELLRDELVNVV